MILEARGISKCFTHAGNALSVLERVDLAIAEAETVAIRGQSGSGKSTLLSLLAGLDRPSGGKILVGGEDLGAMSEEKLAAFRARNIGIVFQQFHLMANLTAAENVGLPLEIARNREAAARARRLLAGVGLASRADHFPHQLSGGERQRVAIARALVAEPRILLADEPSGNLDATTGSEVMALLFDLVGRRKATLILVTHNEELARLCGRALLLRNGRLVPAGSGASA